MHIVLHRSAYQRRQAEVGRVLALLGGLPAAAGPDVHVWLCVFLSTAAYRRVVKQFSKHSPIRAFGLRPRARRLRRNMADEYDGINEAQPPGSPPVPTIEPMGMGEEDRRKHCSRATRLGGAGYHSSHYDKGGSLLELPPSRPGAPPFGYPRAVMVRGAVARHKSTSSMLSTPPPSSRRLGSANSYWTIFHATPEDSQPTHSVLPRR